MQFAFRSDLATQVRESFPDGVRGFVSQRGSDFLKRQWTFLSQMVAEDVFEAVSLLIFLKVGLAELTEAPEVAPPSDDLPAEVGLTEPECIVAMEF